MLRSLRLAALIVVGIVIYAYGFSVTQVNLEQLGSPTRQESLARIMRALAHPDFVEFDQEQVVVEVPIYVPCPAAGAPEYAPEPGAPYMVVTPPCAEARSEVTVEGFDFAPDYSGNLSFIPPSGVQLQLGRFETDGDGYFISNVRLRDRTSDEAQLIRAVTRRNVGNLHLSQNGIDTINKIIETVFMALLATTLGTLLAIPVSFFAARNLMVMIKSPVASVALTIILVPVGVLVGGALASGLSAVGALISANLAATISGVIVLPAAALGGVRWAVPQKETRPASSRTRILRMGVLLLASLCVLLALYLFGYLVVAAGQTLAPQLASFRFMGDFFANLGGIMLLSLQPACAVIGAGILASIGGRVGNIVAGRVPAGTLKVINIVLCLVAGVVLGLLIGLAVEWLYQLRRPYITFVAPAVIGGVLGLAVGVRAPAASLLPIGLSVYLVTRTILNALRAVEALIMVIIFAVWVGIGPFAGVLALGLHTVAALAKLYSEQVESISAGPLEAVLATGANRMQMVVYAVIPQIVPPYISFTMYRWDINVRMSTIIGFAGGGGIGFLLQQNINLLNYRAASAQIFAIAIVVSVMDYVSSALRQRTV